MRLVSIIPFLLLLAACGNEADTNVIEEAAEAGSEAAERDAAKADADQEQGAQPHWRSVDPEIRQACFGPYAAARTRLAGDYSLRLYSTGNHLDLATRKALRDEAQAGLPEAPGEEGQRIALDQAEGDLAPLAATVRQCDETLQLPQTAIDSTVDDRECAVRYGVLYASFRHPDMKKVYNGRGSLALEAQHLFVDWNPAERHPNTLAVLSGIAREAHDRATETFKGKEEPDYDIFRKRIEEANACDRKYGMTLSQMPPKLNIEDAVVKAVRKAQADRKAEADKPIVLQKSAGTPPAEGAAPSGEGQE